MQGKGYPVFRLNSTIYRGTLCLSLWPTAINLQSVWMILRQQTSSVMSVGIRQIPVLSETPKEWHNVV